MSKEILRPQNKTAPVPLAHIVGKIDHAGKVWTPAQPKQEPLAPQPAQQEPTVCIHAWFSTGAMADGVCRCIKCGVWWNTITPPTPPQRKALTNEQIEKCIEAADSKWADAFVSVEWARHLTKAIEAAHGIKETTK